jgi:hypothetical protein
VVVTSLFSETVAPLTKYSRTRVDVVDTRCLPATIVQVVAVQLLVDDAGVNGSLQAAICVAEVFTVEQVVVVQALPALAPAELHEATGVGPVLTGAGQVMVVQLFPDVGPLAVHVGAPPAVVSTGHVVVVQPFPEVAAIGVHEDTGTLVVLLVVQIVSVHALPAAAAPAEQLATGTFVELFVEQVTVV